MKATAIFLHLFLLAAVFSGCEKNSGTPVLTKEEQVAQMLSGGGNRVWRLKALKENNVDVALTASQLKYTKTYTLVAPNTTRGTFTDYDGYSGDWYMKGASSMEETFVQMGGGFAKRDYIILSITENTLSMHYVDLRTAKKIEEHYRAY
jgi:hypothetical protein